MNAVLFMLSLTIIQTLRLVQDTAMKLLFQLGNGRAAVVPVQPRLFVRASSELEHGDKPGGGGGGSSRAKPCCLEAGELTSAPSGMSPDQDGRAGGAPSSALSSGISQLLQ